MSLVFCGVVRAIGDFGVAVLVQRLGLAHNCPNDQYFVSGQSCTLLTLDKCEQKWPPNDSVSRAYP